MRTFRRGGMALAGILVLAVGLTGCGGSGSKAKSTTTAAITKAEFLAKANAICAQSDPALSKAAAKLAGAPRADVEAAVRRVFVPAIEAQIAGIRGLGTPSGEQADVARLLGLVRADLDKLKRDPALNPLTVFADFANVAHPYGLTSCAPLS